MFDLKQSLTGIAEKWKYKLDELSPNVYRMDVALKVNDTTWRYQFVYLWEVANRFMGKPVIYMNSRCGEYTPSINLYSLIKEAGFCNLSAITVTTDKRDDGSPCETVICQAALPIEYLNLDLLDQTIYEVANNADILEEKFFGGDRN